MKEYQIPSIPAKCPKCWTSRYQIRKGQRKLPIKKDGKVIYYALGSTYFFDETFDALYELKLDTAYRIEIAYNGMELDF